MIGSSIYISIKVDQLIDKWFSRAFSLSCETESELSLCQELTWERWRKAAKIPIEFLTYSKVENSKKLFLSISLLIILIVFWAFVFKNADLQYTVICLSLIIGLLIIRIFTNKTKTKIRLPTSNFNDQD